MALWALGHKDYVEIRDSPRRPVRHISKSVRKWIHEEKWARMGGDGALVFDTRKVPRQLTLKCVRWGGGKVVGSVPVSLLEWEFGIYVRHGVCKKLEGEELIAWVFNRFGGWERVKDGK